MSAVRSLGAWAGLIVFASGAAWAQQYPAKPVRVVVVFPAGGGTDIVSRIVFQKVSEQIGQQFVIDNRAGAAGMIGAEIVAKSPPDGYTVMVYSQTFINNMHLYRKVPFELKDFAAVAMLTRFVGMLTVHPSMPVRTTKEFIALAKARPGEILYGSAGIGAFQHLSMSVFATTAGIKMNHVPFKGGGPAVVALLGGEIQSILTPIAEVYPHVKSGRLRPIAVSSAERTTQFPKVPAISETLKGYEFTSWFRLPRSGRHAEAGHRQAERRDQESAGGPRYHREARAPGPRSDVPDARGIHPVPEDRVRPDERGREGFRGAHRVTDSG
jgi:tripartite-type tricarboxylate transporter receptor subunit TctC